MASLLQLAAIACILVAVVALTDWRWGLLVFGVGTFTVGYLMERRKVRSVRPPA